MVADGDLTRYDLSGLKPVRFEFAPKSARLNMRLPDNLLAAVKDDAAESGVPRQRQSPFEQRERRGPSATRPT